MKFFKNILNFPRMHFGHPRSITTFKNQTFLKIWVFQGFPYTRLDHFGLMFRLKVPKNLQKMDKEWWKNEKKIENLQKYSKLSLEPSQSPKNRYFLKIWVFQGFLCTILDHFGLIFGLKISKLLQKMLKEWWKNFKNLLICQKYSKLPQNTFWTS